MIAEVDPSQRAEILLITGDDQLAKCIARCVERHGYRLARVSDVESAIARCVADDPRLVLMDGSDRAALANFARRLHGRTPVPLIAGQIRIEPTQRIVSVNGRVITCTASEYNLIEYLARHAGLVVSREELTSAVCGRKMGPMDRSLDVHISHLRQKLGGLKQRIVTVRGVGYMLTLSDAPGA